MFTEVLVVCPPLVKENWQGEFLNLSFISDSQLSMGKLSNATIKEQKKIHKRISLANILIIDEAHNYLNSLSNRSDALSKHNADHVILATATPINKKLNDLLRLIELLDVDNLSYNELEHYIKLRKQRSLHTKEQLLELSKYIWKYTVRSTKKELKEKISANPHLYLNDKGAKCNYPHASYKVYNTGEDNNDETIAKRINDLAAQLKGIVYLQKLNKPDFITNTDEEAEYLKMRFKGAKALAIFNIQDAMRSSSVALIEHIYGTEKAKSIFAFNSMKSTSGNIIEKLTKRSNSLPKNKFDKSHFAENTWLIDLDSYKATCAEEINIYQSIGELAKELSNKREKAKANQLLSLLKDSKHEVILAFDSTVITLDYLHHIINQIKQPQVECIVVTSTSDSKQDALDKAQLHSDSKNLILLCSDAMSEGVNLQKASALVMLDMPSVLRVAEQRIGRLDRLNSPHEQIEIYWPEDKPAFRLRTDFKLFRTLDAAKAVIGINFDVPIEIKPISAKEAIKLYQTEATKEENWEGIQDAFKAVTDLYRKKDGLITEKEYLYLKGVQASVKCKLSIVRTMQPWIFIATKGSKHYSPKWYFIDCYDVIHTDLTNICYQLTDNLSNIQKKEDTWVSETEARLEKYLEILQINERQSLPNKKNRALEVAEYILKDIIKKETNTSIAKVASSLLTYFKPFKNTEEFSTDFLLFSQQWLNIFQPYLSEKRRNSRNKKKVISLNDLKKDYKGLNISIETLEKILSNIPMKEHTWRSVAACIIGIPDFTPIEPDTPIGEI